MPNFANFFATFRPQTARQKTGWAVAAATAVAIVASFEGFAAKPYVDTVGRGHPETWCYGTTKADHPAPAYGTVFTKAECQKLLAADLVKYDNGVKRYVHVVMGPNTEAAMVSAAYNLGPGVFAHGSMTRYLNAGGDYNPDGAQSAAYRRNHPHACNALLAYDRAAGRVLAGLARRRRAEAALCHKDD